MSYKVKPKSLKAITFKAPVTYNIVVTSTVKNASDGQLPLIDM